jgi:hypothetical protein
VGFGFRLLAPVMASLVTRSVAALSARSGNREAPAKGGAEAGAERTNDLKSAGRPMGRELSTDRERPSSVVCDRGRDRARHAWAAIATIAKTTRSEASRALLAKRRWTHEARLSVLLASAPPSARRLISRHAAGSPISRDPEVIGDPSRSRADRTKPVMALFIGAC